jgi:hypothetical protein
MMPVLCSAIVLYDFEATPNSQEISVLSGSKLDIIEKQDDGYILLPIAFCWGLIWRMNVFRWWRAVLEDPRTGEKKSGYVPA